MSFIVPNTFSPNTVADANAVNANFVAVEAAINSITQTSTAAALVSSATGAQNLAAFQVAQAAVTTSGGGTIIIPSSSSPFYWDGPATITGPTIIQGTSEAATLYQQVDFNSILAIQSSGYQGITVEDITLQALMGLTTVTAIQLLGGENFTANNVRFVNCQQALNLGTTGLSAFINNCTIIYDSLINNQVMVFTTAAQTHIFGGEFRQLAQSKGGAVGCTCAWIQGAQYTRISDIHISDWNIGVLIDHTDTVFLEHVNCQSWQNCVSITSSSNNGNINDVFIDNCAFRLSSGSTSQTPLIVVNTAGGNNTLTDGVEITGTECYLSNDSGLQITGGQNIKVNGGRYSANGQNPASVATGAGVAITGGNNIELTGVNLTGTAPVRVGGGTQPYGLAVTGSPTSVRVIGCNLTGNSIAAVYAPNPVAGLEIIDCEGYNDQNTVITNSMPTSGAIVSAQTIAATPYFGPATFEISGGTITSIKFYDGATAGFLSYTSPLTAGTFALTPGQYFSIEYTGSPTFVMVGR